MVSEAQPPLPISGLEMVSTNWLSIVHNRAEIILDHTRLVSEIEHLPICMHEVNDESSIPDPPDCEFQSRNCPDQFGGNCAYL